MRNVISRVVLCAVIGLAIGVSLSIGQTYPTDQTNPYYQRHEPNYFLVVMEQIAKTPAGFAMIRKNVMDKADLPILEIWFSEGAMYAVYNELPITSWKQLKDIQYVSATSKTGKPRAACSAKTALQLLFLYDLPMGTPDGSWPWA